MTAAECALHPRQRTPIAVVGMSCRLPGRVDSPESYWRLLRTGGSGVVEVPADRWNVDAYFDPNPRTPGRICSRHGGFLRQPVDRFDAAFFGISAVEAEALDPAQRLLLELTWECLEHAGIPAGALQGTDTGVFVGLSSTDYMVEQARLGRDEDLSAYHATGVVGAFASGRLAHLLGAEGPCATFDTACSSSLVAVASAADALWSGRCGVALAGGSSVLASPRSSIALSRLGALSPTGQCRVFDEDADGYVRGEGGGMLVLKLLSEAEADGDRVFALLRAAAWNHHGRSAGLTVPRQQAQERVMAAALAQASLRPEAVGYIEAHGTGTPVGDPVEANAIARAFGGARPDGRPLMVGSCKTNLGHLEAASGIASVIKVVLALQHQQIPPHLHFHRLNPRIDWSPDSVVVPSSLVWWEPIEGRRIAGVNSFGLGGTNAHLLLEEAPPPQPRLDAPESAIYVLPVSGASDAALGELARSYQSALSAGGVELRDICHTAAVGREHLRRRIAAVGSTSEEVAAKLAEQVAGGRAARTRRVSFLCTGQGAQYAGMGRGLYAESSVFREVLDRCDALLRTRLGHPLLAVMFAEEPDKRVHRTEHTQPALFALEIALAELWRSWGIEPDLVVGHGLGEYVAATIAGVFDLEDALLLVSERGRLMAERSPQGSMVVVFAAESVVRAALTGLEQDASIAAVDGPSNTVVGGAPTAVQVLVERLAADGVESRALDAQRAFHSPLMDQVLDPLEAQVRELALRAPRIPLLSNLTGARVDADTVTDPIYWRSHARQPVRFKQAIEALAAEGVTEYIEIGPSPTLLGLAARCVPTAGASLLPSMRPGRQESRVLSDAVATLYSRGATIDWRAFTADLHGRRVSIPTYPFQRSRHWFIGVTGNRTPQTRLEAVRPADEREHPLLGVRLRSPAISGVVYQALLQADHLRLLRGHRIGRAVVVPAAVLVEAAAAAVADELEWSSVELADLAFEAGMHLPGAEARIMQICIEPPHGGEARFQVVSAARTGAGEPCWVVHVRGTARRATAPDGADAPDGKWLDAVRRRLPQVVDGDAFHELLAASGVRLHDSFKSIASVGIGEREALGAVCSTDSQRREGRHFSIHPALLHAVLQLPAVLGVAAEGQQEPLLPVRIGRISILPGRGEPAWVFVRQTHRVDRSLTVSARALDATGHVVVEVEGLVVERPSPTALQGTVGEDQWTYDLVWRDAPSLPGEITGGRWLVLEHGPPVAPWLVEALQTRGVSVQRYRIGGPPSPDVQANLLPDPPPEGWARRCLDDVVGADGPPLDGVVWLAAKTAAPTGQRSSEPTGRAAHACSLVTELVRVLTARSVPAARRLVLVTHGAAGTAVEDLAGTSLWGLQPVAGLEHPELPSSLLDVSSEAGAEDRRAVLAELASRDREDRVVVLGGKRTVPRLVRGGGAPQGTAPLFKAERAYFVSGGMGGIGRALARWLASHGAGLVVVNGRRAPDEASLEWIDAIRRGGGRIEVVPGDVSRAAEAAECFVRIAGWGLPLGGIFHAAGVLEDGPLSGMDEASFHRVMAPKVAGAWNLHRIAQQLRPEYFVLFGSIASVLGSPLQGNYAAANAVLGGLASWRARQGMPAVCVDWGPWAGDGMAGRLASPERDALERRGLTLMDADRCLSLLEARLRSPSPHRRVVMSVDWQRLQQAWPTSIPPLLEDVVPPVLRALDEEPASPTLLRELAELPADERLERCVALVCGHVADAVGVDVEQLSPQEDARAAGFDSLMALELRRRLEADLGIGIPVAVLIGGVRPVELAADLVDLIGTASSPDESLGEPG